MACSSAPSRTAFSSPRSRDLEPGRALDLACGSGRNAVWLAFRGWPVTGVDFSDVALEQARGLAAERGVEVDWVEADLLGWRPFDAAFDLVVVLYLQLPAERARGGAAPGRRGGSHRAGRCSSSATTATTSSDGSGGPKDPGVLFTPEQVAESLAGLRIERADAVLRPVEGERDAIDALVRARR